MRHRFGILQTKDASELVIAEAGLKENVEAIGLVEFWLLLVALLVSLIVDALRIDGGELNSAYIGQRMLEQAVWTSDGDGAVRDIKNTSFTR